MLLETLAKAASSNHGVTLQPLQVQELVDALTQQQLANMSLNHRLDVAVRITSILLSDRPEDVVEIGASRMDVTTEGFWLFHDKGSNVIKMGLGQEIPQEVKDAADYEAVPMEVPEVRDGADNVRPVDFDIASVPEGQPVYEADVVETSDAGSAG